MGIRSLKPFMNSGGQDFVHRNHNVAQRAAAETLVVCEDERDLAGQGDRTMACMFM